MYGGLQDYLDGGLQLQTLQTGLVKLENHYHPLDDRPLKWLFHRADWNLHRDLCMEVFLQDYLDGGLQLQTFTDRLSEIAKETIPKCNPNSKKPWFSDERKHTILDQRQSLRI